MKVKDHPALVRYVEAIEAHLKAVLERPIDEFSDERLTRCKSLIDKMTELAKSIQRTCVLEENSLDSLDEAHKEWSGEEV